MPTHALLCALRTQRGDDAPVVEQRLFVLPERVHATERCPVAMACALAAALFWVDFTHPTPVYHRRSWRLHRGGNPSTDTLLLPPGYAFPIGSWGWTIADDHASYAPRFPLPPSAWEAVDGMEDDVVLTLRFPDYSSAQGASITVAHAGAPVACHEARAFFPPKIWSAARDKRRDAGTPLDVHTTFQAWADSTALPVLLGALDRALPLAFEDTVGDLPKRPWMAAVLMGANRVYTPWRGERSYPLRGYGRRPFPANTPTGTAEGIVLETLLGAGATDPTKDWTGTMALRGDLAKLVAHGVLEPNRAIAPTHWIGGRHWNALLAAFPADLVEAGRLAGAIAQQRFAGMDVHDLVAVSAPAGSSKHQAMALRTGHVLVDEALSSAQRWVRTRRRRIAAPMIAKEPS